MTISVSLDLYILVNGQNVREWQGEYKELCLDIKKEVKTKIQ